MRTLTLLRQPTLPKRLSGFVLHKTFLYLLPFLVGIGSAKAQLSITSTGTDFTQNFDGMGTSATAAIPGGFKAGSNSNHTSNGTNTTQAGSAPSSSAAGGCYNFGNASNAADRCVGFLNSGSYTTPNYISLQITNNTGAAISGFTLEWDYEKYRSGNRIWDWAFFHGTGSTPTTAVAAGNQNYASDGANTTTYNPPQSISKTVTITGLNLANGASYYFQWRLTGNGGSSNGQGLGIDNFVINATPAACTAPSTQASNITFSTVTSNSVGVNWTNGNGGGRVVMMNTTNSFTAPGNGTNPTANTAYSGSGQQVVYNNTGSGPVTVTGLTPGATYYFRVYEFCTPSRNYQTTTGTNNPNSVTTLPLTSISTSASVGGAPFTLANCAATGAGTINYTVVGTYNAGNTFTAELSDASGSFASPTNIGTLVSTGNGSINITIPATTATGSGYKIRVTGSNPVITGSESAAFTITQNGVCASLASHYFRSAQTGGWSQIATWESSPDQVTWIAATLVPTSASSGILIQAPHTVTVNSTISADQMLIEAGATLNYMGSANMTVADGTGDDLIIEGTYIHAGGTLPAVTGTVRIKPSGRIRVSTNTAGSSALYGGTTSTRFFYETDATFEWNSTGVFSSAGQTYFPNAGASEIPVFLLTSNLSNVGGAGATTINGKFEVANGFSISWTGAGNKIFRNGFKIGTGSGLAQNTAGTFLITGNSASFDGPGTLGLSSAGLTSTAAQLNNGSDITVNTSAAQATINGGWVGNGHTISGTAEMVFGTGAVLSGQTTFTRLGVGGTASISAGTGHEQTVIEYASLRSGTLTTNNNITFLSDASGTAYINDFAAGFTGSIVGNVHMQRYNPLGVAGFRQLGTPVQMPNISGVTGFTPSGTAGFVIPVPTCDPNYVASNSPYGNWMQLVENGTVQYNCGQSLFEVLTGGGMTNGRGYYMDVAGTSTLTFTGAPNTGIVSFPLTHANTAVSNGWNMVSNPYPSPLQWELVNVPAGVDAIGKIWQTSGAYLGTWQDLDPNAAGTQAAAIGQAFQVRVTVPGTSVPFLVDNIDRTTATPTYLFAGGDPMTLNIDILGNGFADLSKVRFIEGATTGMDAQFDSPKMLGNSNQPMVYTVWNNQPYSTNSYGGLTEVHTLPLGVKLAQTGQHTLAFSNVDQFPPSAMIYLEDTENQIWQDVRSNDTYTFSESTGANESRFVLHFYPPVAHNTTDATCEIGGNISLHNVAPLTWNYVLTDAQNQTLAQGSLQNVQTLPDLPSGAYTLQLTEPNSGYVATETVHIGGAQAVTAQAGTSTTEAEIGEEIEFAATAVNANNYLWNFGDQHTDNTQNPLHAYNASGLYEVTLTASNSDCETISTLHITVENGTASLPDAFEEADVRLWNDGSVVYLSFAQIWEGNARFTLYDLQGRTVFQKQLTDAAGTLTVDCGNLSAGSYTVELVHSGQTLSRKMMMGIR